MVPSRSRHTLSAVLVLVVGLTLAAAPAGPSAVADPSRPPGDQASATAQDQRAERAAQVLAEVRTLLSGDAAATDADPASALADGRSLTIALRDLRMLKDALPAAQQERAAQLLMRPGHTNDPYIKDPLPLVTCAEAICVHYTETGRHQPDGSDGDAATIPAYIEKVRGTVQRVHDTYVAAGYRSPKSDGGRGGDTDKVDIYIGDIGLRGLYGYCTSDDPNQPRLSGDHSLWAYCTLDNDYSTAEFPAHTPLQNMRVTAAHEYFHAVQFAYDAWEDGWILESTATWVEDEVFDDVDDNRYYLASSPLSTPGRSLDRFGGLFHYGTWIWWRFLTEKYDGETGGLPDLVLAVWRRLDGTPDAPNLYSTQGLARVLRSRGTNLKREFQLFSAANRHPRSAYDEGGAPAYRVAPPVATVGVRPDASDPAPVTVRRDHLSSAAVRFNPRGTDRRDWRLRLRFDLPRARRGSAVVVLVHKRDGGVATRPIRLDRSGGGSATVPFTTASVRRVEVVVVNASARFECWERTQYSCQGVARDDELRSTVDARAFRP